MAHKFRYEAWKYQGRSVQKLWAVQSSLHPEAPYPLRRIARYQPQFMPAWKMDQVPRVDRVPYDI